jgi:hypothetical protein
VGVREWFRVVGRSRARAEERVHRRRQWRTAADRGYGVRARGKKGEGFYRPSNASRLFHPSFVGHSGDGMGAEAVGNVQRAGGQWREVVRAPASVERSCGTGLGR